jgi:hypothetical protein
MSRREHEFLVNTSLFHEKTYDGIVLFTFNECLWFHPVTVSYISLAGKQKNTANAWRQLFEHLGRETPKIKTACHITAGRVGLLVTKRY